MFTTKHKAFSAFRCTLLQRRAASLSHSPELLKSRNSLVPERALWGARRVEYLPLMPEKGASLALSLHTGGLPLPVLASSAELARTGTFTVASRITELCSAMRAARSQPSLGVSLKKELVLTPSRSSHGGERRSREHRRETLARGLKLAGP